MTDVGELSCDNCGVGHGSDDIFCENCGYDFITGSLPSGDEGGVAPVLAPAAAPNGDQAGQASSPAVPTGETPPAAAITAEGDPATGHQVPGVPTLRFTIGADRTYFDAVVSEGELDFPDPAPANSDVDVSSTEIHIGRTSQSRAIHPDLDIDHLTGDPAVSSRHAVVRVGADGSISVTDVGSTNGTFVGAVDGKAITVGEPSPVAPGSPVYVGAWTKVEITAI